LFNFMDGIDWMTVAEAAPITAALAMVGTWGVLPPAATLLALALFGALLGFAPFNRPVARLFLGDVGSLPIGLMIGWLLVVLATSGHVAAAVLLPLYYLADATVTLVRRLAAGERVWEAHRTHFYQQATDRGRPVLEVVGKVFIVNIVLASLALFSVLVASPAIDAAALVIGAGFVIGLLFHFAGAKR
jgi:UDP-N-acetylmuramyl pentapeptide phosphotransferase/UDP-N-acetylglucosamine-1-phosphate transferase